MGGSRCGKLSRTVREPACPLCSNPQTSYSSRMIRFKAGAPANSDTPAPKPAKVVKPAPSGDVEADSPVALPFGKAPKKESKKAGFGNKKPAKK